METTTVISAQITAVNRLIRERRSVFMRQLQAGTQIPKEIIYEILTNANYAPTHKLTEPWRFTIFSGAGLQRFAEITSGIYKMTAGERFKESKYEEMKKAPGCSHVIAIGLKRHQEVPEMEEIAAVACAVENMYLTVAAYGLGGYWSTGGVTFFKEAREAFGLGEDDRLMGFFYLGYIQTPSPARVPGNLDEKISWVDG